MTDISKILAGDAIGSYASFILDRTALVFNVADGELLSEFPVLPDVGAACLSMSRDCLSVASWNGGVCSYTLNGVFRWGQSIKSLSKLIFSGEKILGLGNSRMLHLRVIDGEVLKTEKGVRACFSNDSGGDVIAVGFGKVSWTKAAEKRRTILVWDSFSVLSCEFDKHRMVAASPDGKLAVFGFGIGDSEWEIQSPAQCFNVSCVAFSEDGKYIHAVASQKEGLEILRIDWRENLISSLGILKTCPSVVFVGAGRYVVSSVGQVFDVLGRCYLPELKLG